MNVKMVHTTARHTLLVTIRPGDSDASATPDTKVMVLHVPQPTHAIQTRVLPAHHVLPVHMAGIPANVHQVTAVVDRATVDAVTSMNAIPVLTTAHLALHVLIAMVDSAVPAKMDTLVMDTAASKMTSMSAIWAPTTVPPMLSAPTPQLGLIAPVQMVGVVMV